MCGPFRRAGHAAEGDADVFNRAVGIERQVEGGAQRGNILVAPLGNLVDGVTAFRLPERNEEFFDEFAAQPVLFAVVDEIAFQRQAAVAGRRAQRERRAECDQGGGRVADGRTVGDIAADRAHIAHLLAAEPVKQPGKRWEMFCNGLEGLAVGDTGTERDTVLIHSDGLQIPEIVDEDDRVKRPHLLRHPQADIG
ncbi:hypothetical protein D3C86_1490370 [compost metagenome]